MTGEKSKGKRKRSRTVDSWDGLNEEEKERKRQDIEKEYGSPSPEMPDKEPPEMTDEDRISLAKSALRNHIGIGEECHPRTVVLFFIELAPNSARRGAACQHINCTDRIEEGSYRIAVHPGMNNVYQNPGKRD